MMSALLILAQVDPEGSVVGSQVWDGGGGYTAVMTLLFLLIAGLVGVFIAFKRFGLPRTKQSGSLELLETRPLGGRQFLLVAKYGEKHVLLGVCPGRIDYLCDLNDGAGASDPKFEEALEAVSKED